MNNELDQDADLHNESGDDTERPTTGDEQSIKGNAGSPRLQDRVQRDRPGYPRAEGFLGNASVVRWLEDAGQKMSQESPC